MLLPFSSSVSRSAPVGAVIWIPWINHQPVLYIGILVQNACMPSDVTLTFPEPDRGSLLAKHASSKSIKIILWNLLW